jgi:hypothetical protein
MNNNENNFGEIIGVVLVLLLLFYLFSYLFNTSRMETNAAVEKYTNNLAQRGLCCGQPDWYLGKQKAREVCGQR